MADNPNDYQLGEKQDRYRAMRAWERVCSLDREASLLRTAIEQAARDNRGRLLVDLVSTLVKVTKAMREELERAKLSVPRNAVIEWMFRLSKALREEIDLAEIPEAVRVELVDRIALRMKRESQRELLLEGGDRNGPERGENDGQD